MNEFVFMVMPFSDSISESLFNHSTRKVVMEFGLDIVRADEIFSTNIIYDDIYVAIENAIMVIVDISGKNPNCFYELGISHSIKKTNTIMITRDSYNTTPFDVAHFRIIGYSNTIKGKATYEDHLRQTLKSILSGLPVIYMHEFEIVIRTLHGVDEYHSLLGLLSLTVADSPISENSNIFIEGNIPNSRNPIWTYGLAKDIIKPFFIQGFVEIIGNYFSLTDKGRYFCNYLESKGYELHILNKKVITKDYKSTLGKGYDLLKFE